METGGFGPRSGRIASGCDLRSGGEVRDDGWVQLWLNGVGNSGDGPCQRTTTPSHPEALDKMR